jgi:hypothetical protein
LALAVAAVALSGCHNYFPGRDGGEDSDVGIPVGDADRDDAERRDGDTAEDSDVSIDADGDPDFEEYLDADQESDADTDIEEIFCGEGFRLEGRDCVDVDECAEGLDDCGLHGGCENSEGSFSCVCDEGYQGDGRSCVDIDECATGIHLCDIEAICSNTEGGHRCTCLAGSLDERGDGSSCIRQARVGHLVLIGHDYFERNSDVDLIIGSAVLLAPTTGRISVLAFTQYADSGTGGEVANADGAIASRLVDQGRIWSRIELEDSTRLAELLPGHHVLLVYEQELADEAELRAIGSSWATPLRSFLMAGGVVVLCDHGGGSRGTAVLFEAAGLLTFGESEVVGAHSDIDIVAPYDFLAWGLGDTYMGSNGTRSYATSDGFVVARAPNGQAVVVHKLFRNGRDFYGLPYDFFEWDEAAAALLHRAVTFGYEREPRVGIVQECADMTNETGPSPVGPSDGEYNATIAALTHAGLSGRSFRPITGAEAARRSMGSFDVLLFTEEEGCDLDPEEWLDPISVHVGRGGRVVITTPGGGGAEFIAGLEIFGRGTPAAAREPLTAVDAPFWEGITHPGILNATTAWLWRGADLVHLGRDSGGNQTVLGSDM